LCASIGIAVTSIVGQDNASSTESKIIAMEKAWNQAYKFRDKKAVNEILDDSVVLVNDDGRLQSKAVFLAGIGTAKPSEEQQAEPESIHVRVFGNTAIATGVFRERGIENGKRYARRNRFVDTWVNRSGSWACVAASATPMLP
jgi:ketosteroid isomerase-like protein